MFTPPPSPLPSRPRALSEERETLLPEKPEKHMESFVEADREAKRWTGRRFRWAVILVPLIVVFVTAWATYSTSRMTQTASDPLLPISWHALDEGSGWHHRRRPEPDASTPSDSGSGSPTISADAASAASLSTSESTSIPVANQPVPNVPSAPPPLPTPFPQPFDGSIVQNFSTVSCSNFFANMTNSSPFRQCRPFSLLLSSSSQFINAQTNLTLMNSIIWGTCNTNVDFGQCQLNMNWFASTLKTSCAAELKDSNTLATNTLTALQAYEVMHDVACQTDPTANVYCFINAVRNSNPVDSYYYGLPLGIALPKTSTPTCSACAKSTMQIYATALQDAVQGPLLTALKKAYQPSVDVSASQCGSGFAKSLSSSAPMTLIRPSWGVLSGLSIFAWMLLSHVS